MEVKVSRQYSSVLIQDLYIYLYICMEVKVSRQYSSVLIQDLFRGAMAREGQGDLCWQRDMIIYIYIYIYAWK